MIILTDSHFLGPGMVLYMWRIYVLVHSYERLPLTSRGRVCRR